MGELVPLALGIAASPFPVIPAILLLFSPRARASSLAFLAGWLLGVGVATTVFVVLAEVVDRAEETPAWASWARIVLGTVLVLYGVRQWLGRSGDGAGEQPAWMRSIGTAGPGTALRLGLLLSAANPKIVLLAAAAGLVIGSDDFTARGDVVAVVLFSLLASVSVAVPVLGHLVLGARVLRPLGVLRDWLERHNTAVMAVVLVVLGLLLLQKGVTSL